MDMKGQRKLSRMGRWGRYFSLPNFLPKEGKLNIVKKKNKWPMPNFDENDQPHFLFIITLPYSGSTALSELLNSSHRTMILQERGEAQWLVPGLCEEDRWDPKKKVNFLSVKAVWLNKYQQVKRLTQNIDVVIEKSPPNMMRIEELSSQFLDYSFIANNRNPYATCASILYRNYNAENISSNQRRDILEYETKDWLLRSYKIKELITRLNIPLLTYENFCHEPESILKILNLPDGVAETINPHAAVKVKDYKTQPITNQNERQISNLTDAEIAHIGNILAAHSGLLEFFGYQLISK